MSGFRAPGVPLDVATLFQGGPDQAPAGLLARSLARSSRTAQRPGLLALALGAPTAGAASRRAIARLVALGATLAVTVATLAFLSSGGPVPLETPRASPSTPAATAAPLATAGPDASQPAGRRAFETGLGLTVTQPAIDPWSGVVPGWAGVGFADAFDFAYEACPDGTCPAGTISLSVGDVNDGAIVDIRESTSATCPPEYRGDFLACSTWHAINEAEANRPVVIAGDSMDALLAAWVDRYGTNPELISVNGVWWAFADRGSRSVAFVIDGRRVVAVTAQPTGASDTDRALRRSRLQLFIAGISFDAPPAPWPTPDLRPVVTRWRGLELTLSGWSVGATSSRLLAAPDDAYGGLPGGGFEIRATALGGEFVVNTGGGVGGGATTVRIGGSTFDELAASVQREVPGTPGEERSIDGHRLRQWTVFQSTLIRPLAWIAILEVGGDVYLLQEHFPVDALFQRDRAEALLAGLRIVDGGG